MIRHQCILLGMFCTYHNMNADCQPMKRIGSTTSTNCFKCHQPNKQINGSCWSSLLFESVHAQTKPAPCTRIRITLVRGCESRRLLTLQAWDWASLKHYLLRLPEDAFWLALCRKKPPKSIPLGVQNLRAVEFS